jgi:hypothetical protein
MYNLKKKVSIIMATIKSKLRALVHKDIDDDAQFSIHALKITNKFSTLIKGTIFTSFRFVIRDIILALSLILNNNP